MESRERPAGNSTTASEDFFFRVREIVLAALKTDPDGKKGLSEAALSLWFGAILAGVREATDFLKTQKDD